MVVSIQIPSVTESKQSRSPNAAQDQDEIRTRLCYVWSPPGSSCRRDAPDLATDKGSVDRLDPMADGGREGLEDAQFSQIGSSPPIT
ncbi:hypothetical protein ON010_g13875 [Phytophthora cinnamomi]|nr:hypothetical protein ON010_g13875 [Phytophthora cinnamomi]